jgi:iron complex outermembrane receptor protein
MDYENLTDVRQSKYEKVPIPPHDEPTFREIWTQVEGFVFNAGIKIKL